MGKMINSFSLLLLLLLFLALPLNAEGLVSPSSNPHKLPDWTKNIVAEFHGYHWFTDGNITHRHFWGMGPYDFSHLKYDTDSNLYIIGGEAGYKFSLPLLERITAGFETSQG